MRTDFDDKRLARFVHKLRLLRHSPDYWRVLQKHDPRVLLLPPATDKEISKLQKFLKGVLPPGLDEFLRHSNGVRFDADWIVYPSDEIIVQTKFMRNMDEYFFPIEHLLFIGEIGDGDVFAFGRRNSGDWEYHIYWSEHETLSCYDCADGILDYAAKHIAWRHVFCDPPRSPIPEPKSKSVWESRVEFDKKHGPQTEDFEFREERRRRRRKT